MTVDLPPREDVRTWRDLRAGFGGAACFSWDGVYRYWLSRSWGDPDAPPLVFVGLNPSTADGSDSGRWPANVILGHAEGCVRVGTRKVKAAGWRDTDAAANTEQRSIGRFEQEYTGRHYAGADGTEGVESWECMEGCPVRMLDEQSGTLKSGTGAVVRASARTGTGNTSAAYGAESRAAGTPRVGGDSGGASRFFYCAKASTAERNALDVRELPRARSVRKREQQDSAGRWLPRVRNRHPTVKPVGVMRWLVRLVTPPGGLVLDPFAGSGTTGCAAAVEGMRFIGCEQDAGSAFVARARIAWWAVHGEDALKAAAVRRPQKRGAAAEGGLGLALWNEGAG